MGKKRNPNFEIMQIFGSVAHVKIPLKKLEKRSKKLLFVGYAPNRYRLWNQEEKKIIIARNVKFEESRIEENKIKNEDETK